MGNLRSLTKQKDKTKSFDPLPEFIEHNPRKSTSFEQFMKCEILAASYLHDQYGHFKKSLEINGSKKSIIEIDDFLQFCVDEESKVYHKAHSDLELQK